MPPRENPTTLNFFNFAFHAIFVLYATDELGLSRLRPRDGARDRERAPTRHAEVEVGQVDDAQAGELGRQVGNRDAPRAQPDPSRLEVAPRERSGGAHDERSSGRA